MAEDEKEDASTGRSLGEPTGGFDALGRKLSVGDTVMLVPGGMLGVYNVHSATPILDPKFPPGSRKVILQSILTPVTAPGADMIPVIKIGSGPTVRPTGPQLVES